MVGKRRLSVSVDAELMAAAEQAVKRGEAPTLSAYVSAGLRRQLENDRRLRAMGEFIAAFEREHGKITEPDIEESLRTLQSRAIHVRPARASIQVPVVRGSRASESRRVRR
jgi:Arc/MetJ-type ribon-helix-helix transcriptional regulator